MTLGYSLGQTYIQLDVLPSRGVWWPRAVLCKVIMTLGYALGQADIQSDIPPSKGIWWPRAVLHKVIMIWAILWVRLTFSQMYPPVEASDGQEQY